VNPTGSRRSFTTWVPSRVLPHEDLLRDDEALDLARAFVNLEDPSAAQRQRAFTCQFKHFRNGCVRAFTVVPKFYLGTDLGTRRGSPPPREPCRFRGSLVFLASPASGHPVGTLPEGEAAIRPLLRFRALADGTFRPAHNPLKIHPVNPPHAEQRGARCTNGCKGQGLHAAAIAAPMEAVGSAVLPPAMDAHAGGWT
jgi:hypothetical protein